MKKSESILVLGLGGVGRYLAHRLSQDGHALTVIDSDPAKVDRARHELDARVICADAIGADFWQTPDARELDYVIAVTNSDSTNILACMAAKRLGIKQKIARVRSLDVSSESLLPAAEIGIDFVIRPEELAAERICRFLKRRVGNAVVDVGKTPLQVVSSHVEAESQLAGLKLKDLGSKHPDIDAQVVGVVRDIETILPDGDFEIRPGDHVYFLIQAEDAPEISKLIGQAAKSGRRVLIIGGGQVGSLVATMLEDAFTVRLLERDERRAQDLSNELQRTECLHGDGSLRDTLLQAGLMSMDTIVVATGDNETNIMTAMMAKHVIETRGDGGKLANTTVTLVNREEYLVLASRMGADLPVNKRIVAANRVLRYVRRGHVLSLAHMHGADAEVVELLADPGAPVTRKPVGGLELKRQHIRIGAVCQNGYWQLATGSTQIEAGDRVICVCGSQHLGDLQTLFLA